MSGRKVVFNVCFGGFSLSDAAIGWMGKRGYDFRDDPHGREVSRHNQLLVDCVEQLGDEANGGFAQLAVCELKGQLYKIREYDGSESVEEPGDVDWTVVP